MCGDDIILSSGNGGETWTAQDSLPGESNLHLWSINFRTALDGWAVALYGRALRTTDGGSSWNEYIPPIQTQSLFGVRWLSASRGVIISGGGIFLSTDGGSTWQTRYSNINGPPLGDLCFADTLNGWVVGGGGLVLRSTDGGNSWVRQFIPMATDYLSGVTASDPLHAWLAGFSGIYKTTSGGITAVEQADPELPSHAVLEQNYPNPFNPSTLIRYTVSGTGGSGQGTSVTLTVFDLLGRQVAVLVDDRETPGTYEATFDGGGLASGLYIYRLRAGSIVQSRTMVLTK